MEIEVIPCEMEVEATPIYLPNHGAVKTLLSKDIVDNLWKLIEESKKEPDEMNTTLAGNISSSLRLDTRSPLLEGLLQKVLPVLTDTSIQEFGSPLEEDFNEDQNWSLDELWVNFQKKHEFNPPHTHSGVYSFVIWMQIPTSFKEQCKLPIAAKSNAPELISNFTFNYMDTLGKLTNFTINMEKDVEGCIVLFPSKLSHQVFAFYENDDERISISGNIEMDGHPYRIR
jgi:hypothetical protein